MRFKGRRYGYCQKQEVMRLCTLCFTLNLEPVIVFCIKAFSLLNTLSAVNGSLQIGQGANMHTHTHEHTHTPTQEHTNIHTSYSYSYVLQKEELKAAPWIWCALEEQGPTAIVNCSGASCTTHYHSAPSKTAFIQQTLHFIIIWQTQCLGVGFSWDDIWIGTA